MSSRPVGYAYAKQFNGNLRGQREPVPARIETRLRIATDLTAAQIEGFKTSTDRAPLYEVTGEGNRPIDPTLQAAAIGRHIFIW